VNKLSNICFKRDHLQTLPSINHTSLSKSLSDTLNYLTHRYVNQLPLVFTIVVTNGHLIIPISSSFSCKLKSFVLVFLPQLSLNFLILSMMDRYASTCVLTSPMHHFRKLKMVPWLFGITVIIACVMSLYSPTLNDFVIGIGCVSLNPTLNTILYIAVHGNITSIAMLIFILLVYRNIKQSRQRVVSELIFLNISLKIAIFRLRM